MIITKTPLRVSFLGGGSDYREFFERSTGYVLGSTINKYVYVFAHPLPEIASEKFRFTYRVTESVVNYRDFRHPVMRTALGLFDWEEPTNFATMSDLPGSSGLGGSSSFTVGLLRVLNSRKGNEVSENQLARLAIQIERDLLKEAGGVQDQYHASFGGLNLYEFTEKNVKVSPLAINSQIMSYISNSMVLIPLVKERDSSLFAERTIKSINKRSGFEAVNKLASLAKEVGKTLSQELNPERALEALAEGVEQGWVLKSSINGDLESFNQLISELKSYGALAAKLCGAGGTGFILVLVKPQGMQYFLDHTKGHRPIRVEIDSIGSQIILEA